MNFKVIAISTYPTLKKSQSFEQRLKQIICDLKKLSDPDKKIRQTGIDGIRGTDSKHTIGQGPIFTNFIQPARECMQALATQSFNEKCDAFLSLERGGSFLADNIMAARNTLGHPEIPNIKIPKTIGTEEASREIHFQRLADHLLQKFQGIPGPITLGVCETYVSGSAVEKLTQYLKRLCNIPEFKKFNFIVLAERQTIHTDETIPPGLKTQTLSDQIKYYEYPVPYILGEDVGYQLAYPENPNSKHPVHICQETSTGELKYLAITPDISARQTLIDIVSGRHDKQIEDLSTQQTKVTQAKKKPTFSTLERSPSLDSGISGSPSQSPAENDEALNFDIFNS